MSVLSWPLKLEARINTVAAAAHFRGYDIDSERVRAIILMCFWREQVKPFLQSSGITIGPKVANSLVRQISGKVLAEINQWV